MEKKKHTQAEAGEVATTSRQCQRQISDSQVKENIQKQLDELLVIQSIFDESILTIDAEKRCGRFVAYPNITESPFCVTFSRSDKRKISENNGAMEGSNDSQKMEIKHLPHIEFTFALDDFYPSEDPPAFLISCQWLSSTSLSSICEHLDAVYNESRSEILYSWFTFLRDDVLSFFNSERELDVSRLLYNCATSPETMVNQNKNYMPEKCKGNDKFDNRVVLNESMPNILRVLREFDEFKREELFANEWYSCNICFSRKQGRECVIFNCNHTNCIDCVKEYLKMQIMEGTVYSLKCPQHKCNAMVTPAMVQKIVGDELFRRYDELLLASALTTMNDIVYCPRKSCQSPVVPEADDLAVCPACNFAFCKFCNYTYHGVSPCRLFKNDDEMKKLLNQYYNGTDSEKEALEKRYGKEKLRRELDGLLSQTWIENFSKSCPKCNTKIEKIDGCNKMFCNRCQSSFCWICLEMLSAADPYSHFRRIKSKCYNKLFVGMVVDDNLNYNVEEADENDVYDGGDDDGAIHFAPYPFQ